MTESTNVIYLISLGRDNVYKLGATRNLDKRMKILARANPWLSLIARAETGENWEDTVEMERSLHRKFADHRFTPDPGSFVAAPQELFTLDGEALELAVREVGRCWDAERLGGLP